MTAYMNTILVVEDDAFLANAYRVKLTKAGFSIRIAFDGDQVFSILSEFTPDVIILDLMIPKKDGFEVLKLLKSDARWKTTPIIIASNLGQEEDISRAMQMGANDYIIKSDLSLNDFVTKIRSFLPGT